MSRTLKMASRVLIGLILTFGAARPTSADDPVAIPKVPQTIQEMINENAPKFGQDSKLITKIAMCESGLQVVSHDNGAGVNFTGIHDATFAGWLSLYEKETHETLNKDSSYDQSKMMAWAFSKGKAYRNQWTTYVAYTNGGTYSFYSPMLHRNFVVHCK